MNKKQEEIIERLKKDYLFNHSYGAKENYEIKSFEINDGEYFVSLVIEVGQKNDESTMAAIFARNRNHFFIGKRGGIKIIDDKAKGHKAIRVSYFKASHGICK